MNPDYTVQESPRAKYVRLKLSIEGNLVIVVPQGYDRRKIPEVLAAKKAWLERTARKLAEQRQLMDSTPPDARPDRLLLRAVGEEWAIDYRHEPIRKIILEEQPDRRLLVYGETGRIEMVRAILKRWLRLKAEKHLSAWLSALAEEKGFTFNNISFKAQKTRWGSCSKQKNINLNIKLLFLPEPMVRYILVHELCHTAHLNHSQQYWKLVGRHIPDYQALDRQLRDAWQILPSWVDRG
ncbi:MAG: M48 family metallopeptidase [Armatimonadetes bacterium]|nr:M48 family metallopeptidase [Armatimonadota bacterium]